MLAIVWTIKRLDTYLRGAKNIIVRTDQQALTFLKKFKFSNARLQRWNLSLQDYEIEAEYLPGKKNNVIINIIERVHLELGRFYRTMVENKHTSWARYLKLIQSIINETHHETTGFIPSEIFLNQKPKRFWE